MPAYKRHRADKDVTFRRPAHECFACNDTGIVVNSDHLVNSLFLSDYDVQDGKHIDGSDLALFCNCEAAYPSYDVDGSVTRGGFREGSGSIAQTQTDDGRRVAIGAPLTKLQTDELHKIRKASWEATERVMNEARYKIANGMDPAEATPEFIKEARRALRPDSWVGSEVMESVGSVLTNKILPQIEKNAEKQDDPTERVEAKPSPRDYF